MTISSIRLRWNKWKFLAHTNVLSSQRFFESQMRNFEPIIYDYFKQHQSEFTNRRKFTSIYVQTYPRSGTNYTCRLLNQLLNLHPTKINSADLYKALMRYEFSTLSSLFWCSSSIKETIQFDQYYGDELNILKGYPYLFCGGNYLSLLGKYKVVKLHHYNPIPENQKVILLVRYPFDTIKSHVLTHHSELETAFDSKMGLKYTATYIKAVRKYSELANSPDTLLLRYEDYFHDFQKTIQRIFDFYQIPFEPEDQLLNELRPNEKLKRRHSYWTSDYSFYERENLLQKMQELLQPLIDQYWPEKSDAVRL